MKKLINKLKRESKASGTSNKMTAETMEEHRRQVLAEGRRFKYPLQYERHRLVFNTIIIALLCFNDNYDYWLVAIISSAKQ
jgi:hypothetical protein